eukprot:5973572-Prymnesium_polylepis.1
MAGSKDASCVDVGVAWQHPQLCSIVLSKVWSHRSWQLWSAVMPGSNRTSQKVGTRRGWACRC